MSDEPSNEFQNNENKKKETILLLASSLCLWLASLLTLTGSTVATLPACLLIASTALLLVLKRLFDPLGKYPRLTTGLYFFAFLVFSVVVPVLVFSPVVSTFLGHLAPISALITAVTKLSPVFFPGLKFLFFGLLALPSLLLFGKVVWETKMLPKDKPALYILLALSILAITIAIALALWKFGAIAKLGLVPAILTGLVLTLAVLYAFNRVNAFRRQQDLHGLAGEGFFTQRTNAFDFEQTMAETRMALDEIAQLYEPSPDKKEEEDDLQLSTPQDPQDNSNAQNASTPQEQIQTIKALFKELESRLKKAKPLEYINLLVELNEKNPVNTAINALHDARSRLLCATNSQELRSMYSIAHNMGAINPKDIPAKARTLRTLATNTASALKQFKKSAENLATTTLTYWDEKLQKLAQDLSPFQDEKEGEAPSTDKLKTELEKSHAAYEAAKAAYERAYQDRQPSDTAAVEEAHIEMVSAYTAWQLALAKHLLVQALSPAKQAIATAKLATEALQASPLDPKKLTAALAQVEVVEQALTEVAQTNARLKRAATAAYFAQAAVSLQNHQALEEMLTEDEKQQILKKLKITYQQKGYDSHYPELDLLPPVFKKMLDEILTTAKGDVSKAQRLSGQCNDVELQWITDSFVAAQETIQRLKRWTGDQPLSSPENDEVGFFIQTAHNKAKVVQTLITSEDSLNQLIAQVDTVCDEHKAEEAPSEQKQAADENDQIQRVAQLSERLTAAVTRLVATTAQKVAEERLEKITLEASKARVEEAEATFKKADTALEQNKGKEGESEYRAAMIRQGTNVDLVTAQDKLVVAKTRAENAEKNLGKLLSPIQTYSAVMPNNAPSPSQIMFYMQSDIRNAATNLDKASKALAEAKQALASYKASDERAAEATANADGAAEEAPPPARTPAAVGYGTFHDPVKPPEGRLPGSDLSP